MIIYEVNLTIEKDVAAAFKDWLNKHLPDMLQVPGFIQAQLLKQEQEEQEFQEKLTVHYQVVNRAALETYFQQYASAMREEGLRLFNDNYSASRRIFEIKDTFLSK